MKHLDTAIQVALLIIAFAGLALIARSFLVFGDVGQEFSGNNPFFIFVRVFLGLLLSVDALIGVAIFWASLVFWKKRQGRLLAHRRSPESKAAGTVLGAFTRQTGSLMAVVAVLGVTSVSVMIVMDLQRDRSQKAAELQQYRDEHPEGPFTKYHPNGQKKIQGSYDENGLIQGPVIVWYESGQKKSEMTVTGGREQEWGPEVHGRLEGPALRWHENGQLQSESFYINNRRDGASRSWWPDGQLKGEGTHNRDGTATLKYWFQNGQLEFDISFVDTNVEGAVTRLMTFGTKENGLGRSWSPGHGDGIWTRWYDNGQMREEIHWSAGQKIRSTYWLDDGQKYSETVYDDARPHGLTRYFDKDGNVKGERGGS